MQNTSSYVYSYIASLYGTEFIADYSHCILLHGYFTANPTASLAKIVNIARGEANCIEAKCFVLHVAIVAKAMWHGNALSIIKNFFNILTYHATIKHTPIL